jgi:hypothetical protein
MTKAATSCLNHPVRLADLPVRGRGRGAVRHDPRRRPWPSVSGYVGGWVDGVIMRIADIQMTFPSIMVAMLLYGIGKGLIPPDLRDEMAIWVLDHLHRPVRMGSVRPDRPRRHDGGAAEGIRAGGPPHRAHPLEHHGPAHSAECDRTDPGDRHDQPGTGDHRGSDPELPGRGCAEDTSRPSAR